MTTQTTTVTLLTIVAEGVLRERLLADLLRLGAKGYTVGEVHGHGTRGVSEQFWQGPQLRIETLVRPETAEQIMAHLRDSYFAHYSVIAYAQDVRVLRAEKY